MFQIRFAILLLLYCLFQSAADAQEPLVLDLGKGVSVELVRVPKGEFLQGSPESESGREIDEVARKVALSKDFLLGTTPVTVAQFRRFVEESGYKTEAESGPSGGFGVVGGQLLQQPQFNWKNPGYRQSDEHPVTIITLTDATAFLRWLSGKAGRPMILPTEAQWEYACRAGTASRFFNGDDDASLDAIGWSSSNSGGSPHPVRQKQANGFGLFDMSGNVYEWCQDSYNIYSSNAATDPLQTEGQAGEKLRHVLRGGSWMRAPKRCRSAARYRATAGTRNAENGFRVACLELVATQPLQVSTGTVDADSASNASTPPVSSVPAGSDSAQESIPVAEAGGSSLLGWIFLVVALIAGVSMAFLLFGFFSNISSSGTSSLQHRSGDSTRSGSNRGGTIRGEKDGFWMTTTIYPIGTEVCYEYWANNRKHEDSVTVNSPDEQFVFTGVEPHRIKIQRVRETTNTSQFDRHDSMETPSRSDSQSQVRGVYLYGDMLASNSANPPVEDQPTSKSEESEGTGTYYPWTSSGGNPPAY